MKRIEFLKMNGEISDVAALHAWVDRNIKWLKNGRHALVLTSIRKKRSLAQNRLMWMWFTCISEETGGQPVQDVHDYYCEMFLRREVYNPTTGGFSWVSGSTSALTTEQFTEFLDKVQADAESELGIRLPNPDDIGWDEFNETYNYR